MFQKIHCRSSDSYVWVACSWALITLQSQPQPKARRRAIERCQIRLTSLGDEDLSSLDLSRARVARTGWRILRELAACVAPSLPTPEAIHRRLAAAWRLGESDADLIRRCLVLIADHELNPSTFVARCVASTAATPYAVVAAALSALSGRLHGGERRRALAGRWRHLDAARVAARGSPAADIL